MLDEVCHLATAALGLLVLDGFIDLSRGFCVAALISSVAIDRITYPFTSDWFFPGMIITLKILSFRRSRMSPKAR
jgi:hypothetical protein